MVDVDAYAANTTGGEREHALACNRSVTKYEQTTVRVTACRTLLSGGNKFRFIWHVDRVIVLASVSFGFPSIYVVTLFMSERCVNKCHTLSDAKKIARHFLNNLITCFGYSLRLWDHRIWRARAEPQSPSEAKRAHHPVRQRT